MAENILPECACVERRSVLGLPAIRKGEVSMMVLQAATPYGISVDFGGK
jgi:hypothetical protein